MMKGSDRSFISDTKGRGNNAFGIVETQRKAETGQLCCAHH